MCTRYSFGNKLRKITKTITITTGHVFLSNCAAPLTACVRVFALPSPRTNFKFIHNSHWCNAEVEKYCFASSVRGGMSVTSDFIHVHPYPTQFSTVLHRNPKSVFHHKQLAGEHAPTTTHVPFPNTMNAYRVTMVCRSPAVHQFSTRTRRQRSHVLRESMRAARAFSVIGLFSQNARENVVVVVVAANTYRRACSP